MKLDGIWSCELGSAYGWESIGTLFLIGGSVTGGGRNHYSLGTYNMFLSADKRLGLKDWLIIFGT